MRLLIVSHDVVGPLMAGPGIRYWELARALAPHAEVTLAAHRPIDLAAPGVRTAHFAWGVPDALAALTARADVVLANGYLLEPHPELATTRARLILDLYDPTLLENLEVLRAAPAAEREGRTRRDVALLGRQLAAGDMFLCATERQRDLYLGALMAAGRVTPARADADPLLRDLIDVVSFGLPAEPPARQGPGLRGVIPGIGPDDPLILWSGGLWDWMDPLTLVRAMPAVLAEAPAARLVFLAGRHPGAVTAPRAPLAARALADELGLLGRSVFFYEEWVPYARRADVLLDATVVVSLHRQHLETAYAALRSRVLDHLWAGLPSLLSDGDLAAALAREHGFALVAPPEDPAAVAAALVALLRDSDLRAGVAARARALAPSYAWPALAQPIVRFLKSAPSAPRDRSTPMQSETPAPAPPPETDVARVERGRLLQATRNSALQALDAGWRLDNLAPPPGTPLGGLRRLLLERLVWPLLYPLLARQQEHNAAVIRAAYATAEYHDFLQRTMAQQVRDFAEQLAALEAADEQLRALVRGEPAPPPTGAPPPEAAR